MLDASTALSWCFEEAQTPYAVAVLDQLADGADVYVHHIWPLEVTYALVKALLRRHISREELFDYGRQLCELRVNVDFESAPRAFEDVLSLAERYQLTTYDAYLELARRLGISIATVDANLVQAAGAVKVPLLQA